MATLKNSGLMVLMGLISCAGVVQAQEPALNIQAPATAPILETAPVVPVEAPVVHTAAPVSNPAPAHVAINVPAPHVVPVVVHTPTNAPAHVVTNAPVMHAVVTPTNLVVAPVAEGVLIKEGETFFVDTWQHPSFQVGTRIMQVKLQEKTRGESRNGSFVGTITEITEEQDHSPDKLYAQVRVPKTFLWVGVSYDHVRAQTMDDSDGDGVADTGGGDGSVDVAGYIPYLQAVWDNQTRFSPYLEVGYAFYHCEFDELPNWSNGGRKSMNLDSTTGFELAAGLGIRLYKNLSADLYVRQMQVDDVTGEYVMNGEKQSDIIFTMSYTAYGAGLSCRF